MTKALTLLVTAGLTIAAFAGYFALVDAAEDTAARETLSRLSYQARIYSYSAGSDPVAVLPEIVGQATTAAGEPVPGLTQQGATLRYQTDDGCWQVTVDVDPDVVPTVTQCVEVAR
jgi:hypothetical protein